MYQNKLILFKIGNTQRLVMSGQNMFYALEPNFCHFSHSPNIYLCSTLDTGYQIFKTKVSRKFISVFCDLSSESNRLLPSDRFRWQLRNYLVASPKLDSHVCFCICICMCVCICIFSLGIFGDFSGVTDSVVAAELFGRATTIGFASRLARCSY